MIYYEIIGVIGIGMILIAFFLNTFTKTDSEFWSFLFNYVGAILICFNAIYFEKTTIIVFTMFWAFIAFVGFSMNLKKNIEKSFMSKY